MAVARRPGYDVQASWSGFRWPLTGRCGARTPLRGKLEARGWREFGWRVDGEFEPAGAPPFSGNATGHSSRRNRSSSRSRTGRRSADGSRSRRRLPATPRRRGRSSGSARDIDPSKFRKNLPGRLAFDFAGSGAGFDKDSDWAASVRKLRGKFRGQPVSGGGGIRRSGDQHGVRGCCARARPARLALDGRLGRDANLDARLVSDDLSAFLPELGGRVDATLLVRDRTLAIAFTGHDLAWQSHRAVILSVECEHRSRRDGTFLAAPAFERPDGRRISAD